jgi:hypothetical protein
MAAITSVLATTFMTLKIEDIVNSTYPYWQKKAWAEKTWADNAFLEQLAKAGYIEPVLSCTCGDQECDMCYQPIQPESETVIPTIEEEPYNDYDLYDDFYDDLENDESA